MSTTPLLHRKRTNKIPQYAESIQSYDSTALHSVAGANTSGGVSGSVHGGSGGGAGAGAGSRRTRGTGRASKLDTRDGVTLPTILNVLSILMFLRFGFIIGQMGVLGTLFLLVVSYIIDLLTTLSVSAIATNGIVKGGGAYYMLSRSLGVEFGGAIGIILYVGQILNSSLNVAGLIEPLMYNFGCEDGVLMQILPSSYWWKLTYCTIILFLCIVVSLIGSNAVSKCGKWLCMILITATISIPLSTLVVGPFTTRYGIEYMGPSWDILKQNLMPHFTKNAAGSQIKGRETFNDMFGIFFPATAGILAGASMSGDLKNPSKSIPRGTLEGLLITFTFYLIVIISIGSSVPRGLLYSDVQVLQTINVSPFIILAGELSTSLFSIIVGIVGSAKVLEAIANDEIIPGLSIFASKDSKSSVIVTWILAQVFLFADLNRIAIFITMAFLMTFIVTNMACALLKLGSAPNFRPSFKYFNTKSALGGTILCFCAMFVVDGMSATSMLIVLGCLILLIHFSAQPKLWGDVSQSLIYHQVRKYLFKLRQDNVKYWRPQILLLVDDPRSCWNLILFCNHLKKGGLYILGHVIVVEDDGFEKSIGEINASRDRWLKIRDLSGVKAFVHVAVSPLVKWGVRNIYLGSGLGSMRPNITMVGFYDLARYKGSEGVPSCIDIESLGEEFHEQVPIGVSSDGRLPTDDRHGGTKKVQVGICEWMEMIEDLNMLNSNIGVAKGFSKLRISEGDGGSSSSRGDDGKIEYIDLYPIDMISEEENSNGEEKNTNFDTCTLILQLAGILHTVPHWKKRYKLRIVMVVEEEWEVEEERRRVERLLEILRMQESEIVVVCLRSGGNRFYEYFCGGDNSDEKNGLSVYDREMLKELGLSAEKACGVARAKRRMTMSRLAELGVEENGDGGDEEREGNDDNNDDNDDNNDGKGAVLHDKDGVVGVPVPRDRPGVVALPSFSSVSASANASANASVSGYASFTSLRRRARCVVLGEVLAQVSGRGGVSPLVFAPLPAVRAGTCREEGACVEWAVDVAVWTRAVGACVLLHAKSVTVTGLL